MTTQNLDLNEVDKIVGEASKHTKHLFLSLIIVIVLEIFVFWGLIYLIINNLILEPIRNFVLFPMIVLLIMEGLLVFISISLARTGISKFSKPAAVFGCLIIIVGIWLDVLSTISVTPDLSREGNPFIQMFQSLHVPIWGLYLLGFLAQLGITIISCALWISFVRHNQIYLQVIREAKSRNIFQHLWVSFGGNLKAFKNREKPFYSRSYRIIWFIILTMIDPFIRLALGLEWLGVSISGFLFPDPRWGYILLGTFTSTVIQLTFIAWIVYSYFVNKVRLTNVVTQTENKNI